MPDCIFLIFYGIWNISSTHTSKIHIIRKCTFAVVITFSKDSFWQLLTLFTASSQQFCSHQKYKTCLGRNETGYSISQPEIMHRKECFPLLETKKKERKNEPISLEFSGQHEWGNLCDESPALPLKGRPLYPLFLLDRMLSDS